MSSTHGQIIESYGRGDAVWITVWDFERQEKLAVPVDERFEKHVSDGVTILHVDDELWQIALDDGTLVFQQH